MVSGWIERRGVRLAGALSAGLIALVWTLASLAAASVLELAHNNLSAFPWLVAGGSAPAVPVAAVVGWLLANRLLSGKGVLARMSFLVVLLNDLLIAIGAGMLAGASASAAIASTRPLEAVALFVGVGFGFTLLFFVGGLIYFGIPGLVMSVPSAWIWERWMRRSLEARPA